MCSLCILTICNISYFEGWIWCLIPSVPDLCIRFTLICIDTFTLHSLSATGESWAMLWLILDLYLYYILYIQTDELSDCEET